MKLCRLWTTLLPLAALSAAVACGSSTSAEEAKAAAPAPNAAPPPVITRSISLEDAVKLALENNPTITAQEAAARAARARVGAARAMTKPQLSTTTFATTGDMPSVLSGSPAVEPQNIAMISNRAQFTQDVMLMYPLYTGGRLRSQIRGARGDYDAAAADVRMANLAVALEAKNAYRRVLLSEHFVEAFDNRVDESRERVRIAEEAFKEGRIAKYDLLRNQTELAEAEQELVNAQRDKDQALIDLKAALGLSQDSQLTLSGDLVAEPIQETLEDALAKAQAARPELAAVDARIQSAKAGVDIAGSAFSPQLYAVAMQDFVRVNGWGSDHGYTVGVTAAVPILDGGRRRSTRREAQAMLESVQAQRRSVIIAITRDVTSAWTQLQAAGKNVVLSQAAVDQAEEDYRVVRLRYEAGKSINVEVLDALAAVTRARTNYAQSQYDYGIAQDRLARAIGNI